MPLNQYVLTEEESTKAELKLKACIPLVEHVLASVERENPDLNGSNLSGKIVDRMVEQNNVSALGLSDPNIPQDLKEAVASTDQEGDVAYELFNYPLTEQQTPKPVFTIYNPAETEKYGKPGLVLDEVISGSEYNRRQSVDSQKLKAALIARHEQEKIANPDPVVPKPKTQAWMKSFNMEQSLDNYRSPKIKGTLETNRMPDFLPTGEKLQLDEGQVAIPVKVDKITFPPVGFINEPGPLRGTMLYQQNVQIDWSVAQTITTQPYVDFGQFIGQPMNDATVSAISGALRYHLAATNATIHNVVFDQGTNSLNLVYSAEGIGTLGNSVTSPYSMGYTVLTDEEKKKIVINATKEAIRNNLLIKMGRNRKMLEHKISPQEQKARDTLRDMLSESEWRRYVTNGFIMVKGVSGKWYQIFNRYEERIRVYENNKHIHNICIHSDKSCPPTDHVISMKVLVEIDEQEVLKGGNVHAHYSSTYVKRAEPAKNLIDIARAAKENPWSYKELREVDLSDEVITINPYNNPDFVVREMGA